jgi:hypothetical protein
MIEGPKNGDNIIGGIAQPTLNDRPVQQSVWQAGANRGEKPTQQNQGGTADQVSKHAVSGRRPLFRR